MGDVVSICADAVKCLSEVHRLLKPGGMFVFTVDNHLAALEHFVASGNLEALAAFVKTGRTEWLTRNVNERFAVRMFTPQQIDSLTRGKGFEIVSRIGKTVIPARQNRKLLEEEGAVEKLVELETILQRDASAASRASHLQIAAKRI
jgi:SAM-dependent methyltransferase